MDSYLRIIKYIFSKNGKENNDDSLDDFFKNGSSFPQFVAIIFSIEKIPGINNSTNIFHKMQNNKKALEYLGENNPFFKSYQMDFNNKQNQVSIINLILGKIYYKTNRNNLISKCNDYIAKSGLKINNFAEFVNGNGFYKLLNIVSEDHFSSEIKLSNNDQNIEQLIQYIISLNIPVIIDKTSFLPENQDILIYQALIIMESKIYSNSINKKTDDQSIKSDTDVHPKEIENNNQDLQKKNVDIVVDKSKNGDILQNKFPTNSDDKTKTIENNKNTNDIDNNIDEKQINLEENKSISSINDTFTSSEILDLPKSSYLNIINHLLVENNKKGIQDLTDFSNGRTLPNLVEILMKEKIPDLIQNPFGNDRISNNMNCLYFIESKCPSFSSEQFVLRNENDQKRLIQFLVKKYLFKDIDQITDECNEILTKFNIHIDNFNKDWVDEKNFIALLSFLSKGSVKFPPTEQINLTFLKTQFSKANCQFIIEDDAINPNIDEFVILYQVNLIIQKMIKENLYVPKIEKKETKVINNNNKALKYCYEKKSCPIVRIFNFIGSHIGIHYDSIDEIINGMTVHLLVKYLMNVDDIPGIKNDKRFAKMNFDSVMNFLREKNIVFKYSSFDFNNQAKRTDNINWFSLTLLNQFFLKDSKTQIMKKVGDWVGQKVSMKDMKQFFLYGKGFYRMLGINDKDNINKYDEELMIKTFQKSNVPFILDADSLTNINNDYILFQIQLIFDHGTQPTIPHQKQEEKRSKSDEIKPIIEKTQKSNNEVAAQMQEPVKDVKEISKIIHQKEEENHKINLSLNENSKISKNDKKSIEIHDIKTEQKATNPSNNQNDEENLENDINDIDSSFTRSSIKSDIITGMKSTSLSINQKEEENIEQQIKNGLNGINSSIKLTLKKNEIKTINGFNFNTDNDDQIIAKEGMIENDDEPDYLFSNETEPYKLYSYKLPKYKSNEIKSLYETNFKKIFNEVYEEFVTKNENCEDLWENYNPTNNILKIYRLFEFVSDRWKYNSFKWPEFIRANKIEKDDILHLVLLQPSCMIDKNIDKDITYKFVENITGCKINEPLNDDTYVEIYFCGSYLNITTRFNININPRKNEYFIILHLRYPPSLKGRYEIDNMQVFLSLISDLDLSFFDINDLDDPVHFINTSMHQINQSFTIAPKTVNLMVLLKDIPIETEEEKYIVNPQFSNELEKQINQDKNTFKKIKSLYQYVIPSIQWIDIDNYKTYNYFLQTILNSNLDENTPRNNLVKLAKYWSMLPDLIDIEYQHQIMIIINLSNTYALRAKEEKPILPLFKLSTIVYFNQGIWKDFLSTNNIDEKDLLYIIFFTDINSSSVEETIKVLSAKPLYEITDKNQFKAYIEYCGAFQNILSRHNLKNKISKKISQTHLACIRIVGPSNNENNDEQIYFEAAIALHCNLIITNNDKNIGRKIFNVLNLYSKSRRNESIKIPKFIKLSNTNNKTKGSIYQYIDFDPKDPSSCSSFTKEIIDLYPYSKDGINNFYSSFNNLKNHAPNKYFTCIFQDMLKVESENKKEEYTMPENDILKAANNLKSIIEKENPIFSVTPINKIFTELFFLFDDFFNVNSILSNIKKVCIDMISSSAEKLVPGPGMVVKDVDKEIIEFMEESVTYIDDDYRPILKDKVLESIKDFIFDHVKKTYPKQAMSDDMIIPIFEKKIELYNDFIKSCMKYIDIKFEQAKLIKENNDGMNEEQISQNSMKYVLAVKESFKELTVEITSDKDLETEIRQDF